MSLHLIDRLLDNKFLLCARRTNAAVVSSDKHLLDADDRQGAS